MSQPVNQLNHITPIDMFADLELSSKAATININADGDRVIVRLSSLQSVFKLLTMFDGRKNFAETIKMIDRVLAQADITLFWQNHHFAILGSKSKPYLLKAIVGLQKVIKFIGNYAIRQRHSN